MQPAALPERLPSRIDSAPPGRFASVSKRLQERTHAPSDAEAKPDRLLRAGVFVPDHE